MVELGPFSTIFARSSVAGARCTGLNVITGKSTIPETRESRINAEKPRITKKTKRKGVEGRREEVGSARTYFQFITAAELVSPFAPIVNNGVRHLVHPVHRAAYAQKRRVHTYGDRA